VTADERAEAVRRLFELFTAGDIDEAIDLAHPDLVMDWSNSIGPLKGTYRGREELTRFGDSFRAAWSEVSWDAEEIVEVDETRLVVVNHMRMRGEGSGAAVEATGAQLWTFRDGLPASVKLYQSKERALAEADAGR
jgi:ketosteroid isomerase-like protein